MGEASAEPISFQSARSARKGRGASRADSHPKRAKRAEWVRRELSRFPSKAREAREMGEASVEPIFFNNPVFRGSSKTGQIRPFSAKKVNLVRCYYTAPFLAVSLADSFFFTNAIKSGKWSARTKGLDEHLPFAQYLHPQVVYKHWAASERTFSAGKG